jgi:hypothetical protein
VTVGGIQNIPAWCHHLCSSCGKKVKQSRYRPLQAQRVVRGIALSFLDPDAKGGGWSAPHPGRLYPRKNPVPILQEAGWAPGSVWTCAKNLASTGTQSPDRPARSHSLYRLSYRPPAVVVAQRFCANRPNCEFRVLPRRFVASALTRAKTLPRTRLQLQSSPIIFWRNTKWLWSSTHRTPLISHPVTSSYLQNEIEAVRTPV